MVLEIHVMYFKKILTYITFTSFQSCIHVVKLHSDVILVGVLPNVDVSVFDLLKDV